MLNQERIINEAKFLILNNSTVRQTASAFGVSKSTVHKDLTERLFKLEPCLFAKVRSILNLNLNQRHLRGGNATRLKFQKEKILQELKKRILEYK